jgi:hypothetical protein
MSKEYISILEEQLVRSGYVHYDDTLYNSAGNYQKIVCDDVGIKYTIDFFKYEWDNRKGNVIACTWEVRTSFILSISKMDCMFSQFTDNSPLITIEEFIDGLWERLEAHYYEKK